VNDEILCADPAELAARLSELASSPDETAVRAVFFRLGECASTDELRRAVRVMPQIEIFDTLASQLEQLAKIRSPRAKLTAVQLAALGHGMAGARTLAEYGVWTYYPWSRRLVHLLPQPEFVELRTNRNLYKITPEERDLLATRRVGVIGLSVGQSIAVTLAIERLFGVIRLADFDSLELSNLNRLRTGVHNLGLPKVYVAAREIAEIDPYLRVECFPAGITDDNVEDFLVGAGRLDVLFEECDSLDIKLLVRSRARIHGIPVVMETSDRGKLDIERFDLEPDRPLFHGLAGDIDGHALRGLSTEQKIPFFLRIMSTQSTSARVRASFLEIDQTITSWPQLASAVTLGGAVCADVCRRLLLGEDIASGRYHIDLEQLVPSAAPALAPRVELSHFAWNAPSSAELTALANAPDWTAGEDLSRACVAQMVTAGIAAPSGGNGQPWQWRFIDRALFLLPDLTRETPWLGAEGRATQLALGAAAENVVLFARASGLHAELRKLRADQSGPFAAFRFTQREPVSPRDSALAKAIDDRCTNRRIAARLPLDGGALEALVSAAHEVAGIRCHVLQHTDQLDAIRDILGAAQQAQFLDPQLHQALVDELRWTEQDALARRDGIDLPSLDLSSADRAGLEILRDGEPVALLARWGRGRGLRRMMHKAIDGASAVVLLTMPDASHASYFDAGRAMQRAWLTATLHGVAFQPIGPLAFMFTRLHALQGKDVSSEMERTLRELWPRYRALFGIDEGRGQGIIFRLFKADLPSARSLRRPASEVLDFA
jgi:molybdopterin/thiamine biosynthesis adenylyltransferase